jgi:pyrrolidone-carboxylate peptidase
MILIYAFSNQWGTNISRRVLSALEQCLSPSLSKEGIRVDFIPVYFHPQSFFHKYIEHNNYSLIIGLGDGGKFLSKIKIETQAKNSYLDKEIYPFSPILLDLNMPPVDNYDSRFFQIGTNMGTYNCNYLAYQTQLYLNQKKLSTRHLFFHLPPRSNATATAQKIFELIQDNNLLAC